MIVNRALALTNHLIGEQLSAQPHPQLPAQQLHRTLSSTLRLYSRIPKHLELFFWVFAFTSFTAACQALVRIPLDIIISIVNSLRVMRGGVRLYHTSLYSCLIVTGFYMVTREWHLLSVSYLYHSFRGQSSVKLYGAGLALEISEKLLTMLGVWMLSKMWAIKRGEKESWAVATSAEVLLCLAYVLVHFFSLYLDFILYTIVLNSEQKNMLMYFFVVNLGKMKAATFKKFQQKNFRKSVVYDGKDRLLKITHSLLFILTAWERIQTPDICQVLLVLFYTSLIDHLRHFSSLAMAGRPCQVELLYDEAMKSFERGSNRVQRCMEWDFTVIPYVMLLLKFLDLGVWSHSQQGNFNYLLSISYVGLAAYCWGVTPLLHKTLYRILQRQENQG